MGLDREEVHVPAQEYVLAVAVYAGTEDVVLDLRDLTGPDGFGEAVGGTGILRRRPDRTTLEQAGGGTLGYGIGTGAAVGIVVGVLLGYPLPAAGVGAVVGGFVGHRARRREVRELVGVLHDFIPVGATALVAVVQAEPWPVLRTTLTRALRVTGWPVDDGPLLPFALALVRGNPTVTEDLEAGAEPQRRADPDGRP